MRIVFMGTPDFAALILRTLKNAGHEIALVITQPDREKGRGRSVEISPVKAAALEIGAPVFQPQRIRTPEAVAVYKAQPYDVGVVAAFGQILPQEVLDWPRFGCVNVHASLLPRLRGAAPIQKAILDGDPFVGVTTMQMDAGLDTGDMLLQKAVPAKPDWTGGSLTELLSRMGAELIVETLARLQEGTLPRTPQEGESSYAPRITKEDGRLDFTQPAAALERRIRAMDPWPGAYCFREGKLLKIWRAEVEEDSTAPSGTEEEEALKENAEPAEDSAPAAEPGTVCRVDKDCFTVRTGQGLLRITELQPEGKKRMDAGAYLRGYPLRQGMKLD